MLRTFATITVFASFFLALTLASAQVAAPKTEDEKIEALIKHVEKLEDAKFVRNGSEYDASTAGRFLRGKWKRDKDEIKSAKQFIEKIATRSSTTGKEYKIKIKDGETYAEKKSAEFLTAELAKLEKKKEKEEKKEAAEAKKDSK
jgi:hypothetical protein